MPDHPICPHLFAVDAAKPFVDVLARYLLDNYLNGDEGLSRVLLLVPTKRSIPSVQQALLRHSGGKPMLMPRIEPLGDADVELIMPELLFTGEESLLNTKAIPSIRRTLELSRLIEQHQHTLGTDSFSADQTVMLAQALGSLIDDLANAEIGFETLHHLVPDDYAEHWQRTIDFLDIIGSKWPERQQQLHGIDAIARRNIMLKQLAAFWEAKSPDYPVIAAGTTGSVPATAELLKVIAGLPTGRVLLPGLDLTSSPEEWDAIGASVSHPQYGLWKLLNRFGCDRSTIKRLEDPSITGAPPERMHLLARTMAPADFSDQWRSLKTELDPEMALQHFTLVEFDDNEQEATAISLMLRDALEKPEKTAMLVTHDRALAQRVAIRLRRYGVICEDGGGMPLVETRAATLYFALLDVLQSDAAPVPLLALLKHPLTSLGLPLDKRLKAVAGLEIADAEKGEERRKPILRGVRPAGGLEGLILLSENNKSDAAELLHTLSDALSPLRQLFQQSKASFAELLESLTAAAETVATLEGEPSRNLLGEGPDSRQLSRTLSEIIRHAPALGTISPHAFPGILRNLLSRETYHPPRSSHPRLTILSPVEARLQHADLVVMAGLNEECWPPAAAEDPWMSRSMRIKAGLEPHERTIGLSAHDFVSLAAAPCVILTRARKVAETPRLASRWWRRLTTVIEAMDATEAPFMLEPAERWKQWAALFDHAPQQERLKRPEPCPPVEARPRMLSISDVTGLLANPYEIYAKRILGLQPLDALDKLPGPPEFGNAIHSALAKFFANALPPLDETFIPALLQRLEPELKKQLRQDVLPVFWRQRMNVIAAEVFRGETERREFIRSIECELSLVWDFTSTAGPFRLKGRLDRVDKIDNESYDILDYKTGESPSPGEVASGRKPQLPLEGVLLSEQERMIGKLLYWSFARSKMGLREAGGKGEATPLIATARDQIQKLASYYDEPQTRYPSVQDKIGKTSASDFAHLERAGEWL